MQTKFFVICSLYCCPKPVFCDVLSHWSHCSLARAFRFAASAFELPHQCAPEIACDRRSFPICLAGVCGEQQKSNERRQGRRGWWQRAETNGRSKGRGGGCLPRVSPVLPVPLSLHWLCFFRRSLCCLCHSGYSAFSVCELAYHLDGSVFLTPETFSHKSKLKGTVSSFFYYVFVISENLSSVVT